MINLIHKILFFFYSLKKKKHDYISLENLINQYKNTLILLPEQSELIDEIKFLIESFQKKFNQKTFLIEVNLYKQLNIENIPVITYSMEQKNFFKLPRKHFIKFLSMKNFDSIIDCNLIDSNFHYWITKSIPAKLKIGIYRKNSTLFNNLVLKLKKISDAHSIYKTYLQLLKL